VLVEHRYTFGDAAIADMRGTSGDKTFNLGVIAAAERAM
jgi:hypothetical protein